VTDCEDAGALAASASSSPPIRRVAVLGVGLIGGSVAVAARRRLGAHVTGWDPDREALGHALAAGVLDEPADSVAAAVSGADVAVVAAPVAALVPTVQAVLGEAGRDCAVTDVGSTKRAVVAACADERYIGGHPLAGAEASGVAHARPGLFEDATWYLTPTSATSGVLLERVNRFVAGLGARPAHVDAATHDRLMAAASHLPHVVANVLVDHVAESLGGETLPPTGPGFRDATRVAGANPALWAQIYDANREALLESLDDALARLGRVRDELAAGSDLLAWQAEAGARRRALLEVGLTGGPRTELRVAVPNRPGVVADLALTLARAGINISDMSLGPAADGTSGVVALWVAQDAAERARGLVADLGFAVT